MPIIIPPEPPQVSAVDVLRMQAYRNQVRAQQKQARVAQLQLLADQQAKAQQLIRQRVRAERLSPIFDPSVTDNDARRVVGGVVADGLATAEQGQAILSTRQSTLEARQKNFEAREKLGRVQAERRVTQRQRLLQRALPKPGQSFSPERFDFLMNQAVRTGVLDERALKTSAELGDKAPGYVKQLLQQADDELVTIRDPEQLEGKSPAGKYDLDAKYFESIGEDGLARAYKQAAARVRGSAGKRAPLVQVGPDGKVPLEKSPKSQIQKDLTKNYTVLAEVDNLYQRRHLFTEHKDMLGRFHRAHRRIRDRFGRLLPEFAQLSGYEKQQLGEAVILDSQIEAIFNEYRKLVTGAAASNAEIERLRESMINSLDSPVELEAKMKDLMRRTQLAIRVRHKLLRDGIVVADDVDENGNTWVSGSEYDSEFASAYSDAISRGGLREGAVISLEEISDRRDELIEYHSARIKDPQKVERATYRQMVSEGYLSRERAAALIQAGGLE